MSDEKDPLDDSLEDGPTARLDFGDALDDDSAAETVTPTKFGRRQPRASGRVSFEPGYVVANRYRIVRFIARGGMGEVYEAEDLELGGSVALKTIRAEVAEDEIAVERFRREIQIARKVTHRNVCRVFDVSYDQSGDTPVMFVTMELLEGRTLREVTKEGPMPPREALPIARQIADGLAAAHRVGVIHRDLKSANVMLVPEAGHDAPRVVVTDFGLARASIFAERTITNTGDILGSPAYMSPEQIEGKPLTPATDIYAFGVVLYEMVTRGHPFEADTPLASVLKRLREPATSPRHYLPDLDLTWERAILRCLEREPEDRYADPREVIAALEGGVTDALPSRRRARMRGLGVALAVIAVLGAIAAFIPWKRVQIAPAAKTAVAVPARQAVAVTGFRNQSGDADVAWLSSALSEMLTTEIAAGEQVRTVPGETVARTKRELGIGDAAFDARLRNALGTDFLVGGTYAAIGNQLRVDIQLQEALGGNIIASFAETGTADQLFDLVSRAGSRLREKLGVTSVSPEAASGILASLPSNPAAVRYYAEGLAAHRNYESERARELLEKAVAADANFPLAHAALAAALRSLGYEARAKQEAQIALERSAKLPREARLTIEAQAHSENGRHAQAAEIYQALSRFYPDNLDYAIRAAMKLIDAGKGKEALALVDRLKKTANDPRIDLAEADAAESVSDYARSRAAALRAVQKADARGQRLLAARARLSEGYALLRTSKGAEARAAFEDSKRRYEAAGDRTGALDALGGIADVLLDDEQFDAALAIYEDHLKIARGIGSRSAEAADLHNIGMVLHRKGDLAGAKAKLEEALAIQREVGDQRGVAKALGMLAGVASDGGKLDEGIRLYEQAMAVNERIGAVKSVGNNRNNIAVILHQKGDAAGSERLFQQALVAFRQAQDDVAVADVLNNIAALQRARGDSAAAEKSYLEAEQVYRKMNSRSDLAMIAVNMSTIRMDRGDLAGAKQQAETALTIWRGSGEKSYMAYALIALADAEAKRGDLARAEALARESLATRRQIGEESTAAESLMFLADVALEQGRLDQAAQLAREALAIFEKEQRADMIGMTKAILARIAIARGDLAGARTLLQNAGEHFTVTLADARLATASKKPEVAIRQLTEMLAEVTKQGLVPQQFDTRLALAEANLAAGRTKEARTQFDTLEWDANKRGFGVIARKAAKF